MSQENNNSHHISIKFAVKEDDGLFHHAFPTVGQVRLCSRKTPVKVQVTVSEDGDYWGWDDGKIITMIFISFRLLSLCFSGGIDESERKGLGRRVRLKIEEYREPEHELDRHINP